MSDDSTYFIRGYRFGGDDANLQHALQAIYGTPERARCMCVPGGVEMYVSKLQHFVLKRMPGTGAQHAPYCDHYEPPTGDSGLGVLRGDSLIEDTNDSVQMYVDFPLTRRRGRAIDTTCGVSAPEVRAVRHPMSLRAVTHYLLDQARFNRWSPAMEGKRSQAVFRKYLLQAAEGITIKNFALTERLYIPEQFRSEDKQDIRNRRRSQLSVLERPGAADEFPMALVMGEYKSAEEDKFGHSLILKHMPDAPITVDTKLWARTLKKFKPLFLARQADGGTPSRILVTAVIYSPQPQCYQADAIFLNLASYQWIPVSDPSELALVHHLVERRRRFIKPLPYDAQAPACFPNILLLDTSSAPTPLHILSGFMSKKERGTKERLISQNERAGWIWRTEEPIPALPAPMSHVAPPPMSQYPSRSTE